jgi:hypothetical protein
MAALSQDVFQQLSDYLLQNFPENASEFNESFSFTLLQQFARYYGGLSLSLSNLDECHRALELASQALPALAPFYTLEDSVEEEAVGPRTKSRRVSQRTTKKLKRAGQMPTIDIAVFTKLGVNVPSSKAEAIGLACQILDDQKNVLKVCSCKHQC